jgi:hypothetical protein
MENKLSNMREAERVELMERILGAEIDSIAQEAQELSETFWSHRDGLVELKTGEGKYPVLGCRVQHKENTLSMSWFYYRFYKPKGGEKAKRSNIHIKKPKRGDGYSVSTLLKYAVPEQENMVRMTEEGFAELRGRMEVIRKLKHNLHYYKKVCGIINEKVVENVEKY